MKRDLIDIQGIGIRKNQVFTGLLVFSIFILLAGCNSSAAGNKKSEKEKDSTLTFRFDLGPGRVMDYYTGVKPGMVYSAERGYGFCTNAEIKGVDTEGSDALKDD